MKRKKILFVINNLSGGGAEKILIDTICQLNKQGYLIDICTLFNDGIYDDQVKNYVRNYYSMFDIVKYSSKIQKFMKSLLLRKIKYTKNFNVNFLNEKYDFEVAFLEGPATKFVASRNNDAIKYAWVHVDPIVLPYSTKYFKNINEEIFLYKKFDKILCVSTDVKNSFMKKFKIKENVFVQINLLNNKKVEEKAKYSIETNFIDSNKFTIVSVGRLMKQKSYLRLLMAFKNLKKKFPLIQLIIIGEGNERKLLEDFIKKESLQDSVCLYGFCDNPYAILKQCDLFVCSSLTEGFSTVICEAIILGLPILTTDCAGMRDILGENEYGEIVENSTMGLYNGLCKILMNKNYYEHLKEISIKRKSYFDMANRIKEIEKLFN